MTLEQRKKQITKTSYLLIVLSFLVIFLLPAPHADNAIANLPSGMLKTINSGITDSFYKTFSNENELYKSMTSATPTPEVEKVFNVFKGCCGFIVCIIALSRMIENLNKGQDAVESVFKMLIEIFVTFFILMNMDKLMAWIIQLGVAFINEIMEEISSDPSIQLTLKDLTGKDDGKFIWWIQSVFLLIIPWLCVLVMQVAVKFVAFSLLIEIGIRRAFAPLAIVDIYGEGLRSPGVRYLKRFFAVFIKMCICIFVCSFGNTLMKAGLQIVNAEDAKSIAASAFAYFEYVGTIIAGYFTMIGIMFKAGEYANDIVGA